MFRSVVVVPDPSSGACEPTLARETDAASKTKSTAGMDVCSDVCSEGYSLAKRSDSEGGHVRDCPCTGGGRAGQAQFSMISERTVDLYLCSFAIAQIMFGMGQFGLLLTDSRFVYRPDEAKPHEAGVLRLVRVMDVLILAIIVGMMLRFRRQPLEQVAETGIRSTCWLGVIFIG